MAWNMRRVAPGLKILFIATHPGREAMSAGLYPPDSRFLAKPFTVASLLSKVRETLDSFGADERRE